MEFKSKRLFAVIATIAMLLALIPAPALGVEANTATLDVTDLTAGAENVKYTVEFTLVSDLGIGDIIYLGGLGRHFFKSVASGDVRVYSNNSLISGATGGSYKFTLWDEMGMDYWLIKLEVQPNGVNHFNPEDVITVTIDGLTNRNIAGDYTVDISGSVSKEYTNPITIEPAKAYDGDVVRVSPKNIKAVSLVELKFTGVEDEHGNPVEGAHEVFIRGSMEVDPWFDDSVEFAGGEAGVWFPMGTVGDFPAAFALVDGIHMGFFEVYVSPVEVIAVAELDEIDVEFGTPFAGIPFPDNVEITTDADLFPEVEVDVDWQENPDYNPAVPGKYGFAGELQLVEHAFGHHSPGLMKNPHNLMAEVTVIVAEEEADPPSVAQKVEFFINELHYLVDGEAHLLDAPPFIENGRTFIPVRFLAEALGAQADWGPKDALTEWVTMEDEERLVTINIGKYLVNVLVKNTSETEEIIIDVAAMIRDGRTFLPFRAVAEAFGADVGYATDEVGYVKNVWFTR